MDEKKQAVGIFTLPVGMYCDVECLSAYNVIVAEKHIRIHFPQYKEPEDTTCSTIRISLEILKHL